MLTYSELPKIKRKDRPWLLVVMALLWVAGSCFFHDPWEPYEPYVVAIVKGIIASNSWLIPYLSPNKPYLDLQPFYFWLFAIPIKIFDFTNIANAVRLINAFIIFSFIFVMGKVGHNLSAFKNGRTVVMILISTVGFINNAYQLSPHIVVLLGFALLLYALQSYLKSPGASAGVLSLAFMCISTHFTVQFLLVAILLLAILPMCHHIWRNKQYIICVSGGLLLFLIVFISYVFQLYVTDANFLLVWSAQYFSFANFSSLTFGLLWKYIYTYFWYLIPSCFLLVWTIYKRKNKLLKDTSTLPLAILAILFTIFALLNSSIDESIIFPIIVPIVLLSSLEVDSIRINFVSLFNWFSIFIFGSCGGALIALYLSLAYGHPYDVLQLAYKYAPNYRFHINFWQILLAFVILIIWLFMITRKHIRGREVVSNWAAGSTFVAVMFMALCLPWFNSMLSFNSIVGASSRHINTSGNSCVASISGNRLEDALWYYYQGIHLVPSGNLYTSGCNQAIITMINGNFPEQEGWKVVWRGRRAIDFKTYYLLERQ